MTLAQFKKKHRYTLKEIGIMLGGYSESYTSLLVSGKRPLLPEHLYYLNKKSKGEIKVKNKKGRLVIA